MKLGYFTMPMHPPGRNYTRTLKEDRDAILLADALGYCEAYVGEHISDRCETIPSCLSFIVVSLISTRAGTCCADSDRKEDSGFTVSLTDCC